MDLKESSYAVMRVWSECDLQGSGCGFLTHMVYSFRELGLPGMFFEGL